MFIKSRRDGFAIPMAILLIGVITAGVVGAFARVESEHAAIANRDVETDAYALAEAGLNAYLSLRQSSPKDTTITLIGGTAQITIDTMRVEDAVGRALFAVRATGIPNVGAISPPARHDVVQLAWFRRGDMEVHSSWTSISGLIKNGVSGSLNGTDACGTQFLTGCACQPTVAGVAVPTGGYDGQDDPVSGDPPIKEMGTPQEMADQINIDWNAIANENSLNADYTIPPDVWPTAQFADPDFWPVIHIEGNTTLPSNGRGTLIVTGDLTLGGGDQWTGILLVGGRVVDNGEGQVRGAVVSGLDVKLGENVNASSRANGTKAYSFDSCAVKRAASEQSALIPMRNTWIDNWAAY